MGQLSTDLVSRLTGLAPFEEVMNSYPNPSEFNNDLNNYLVGGVVISTPRFFVMGKPVDSKSDPRDQWWVDNPDAWYVRWFAGKGAMQALMDAVEPLKLVTFQRQKNGKEGQIKTYSWSKLYNLIRGN
jgi:hypothetical protein